MLVKRGGSGKTKNYKITSLLNFNICYDKHHTRLPSFIIVFYCSMVIIGKHTKKTASLGTSHKKLFWKNFEDHIHQVF